MPLLEPELLTFPVHLISPFVLAGFFVVALSKGLVLLSIVSFFIPF